MRRSRKPTNFGVSPPLRIRAKNELRISFLAIAFPEILAFRHHQRGVRTKKNGVAQREAQSEAQWWRSGGAGVAQGLRTLGVRGGACVAHGLAQVWRRCGAGVTSSQQPTATELQLKK